MSIKKLPDNILKGSTGSIPRPLIKFEWKQLEADPTKYWHHEEGVDSGQDNIAPYILNDMIKEVVKLAQILQRPILIKGEPGSGKTQLAKALAYEWYQEESLGFRSKFFEWHIKSTSKAVEGLYSFDHLGRLRDTQSDNPKDKKKAKEKKNYREFGPLAKAFLVSRIGSPAVLLIDEIDKADIDFPNDLLLELDEKRFTIPETGEPFEAETAPLIIITSNEERDLPAAFLRRCIFLYLEFPKAQQLNLIIENQLPELWKDHPKLIEKVVKEFDKLRQQLDSDPSVSHKISTSNLIEVLKAIQADEDRTAKDYDPAGFPHYYPTLLKSYAALVSLKKITGKSH